MKEKKIFGIVVLAIIVVAVTSFISIGILSVNEPETSNYDGIPRAAILDQLSEDIPNENFKKLASEYLNASGYEVDIFSTKDITVDFYKELPSMNYQFIIVRTHGVQDVIEKTPMLFTGEKYTEDKYITEQLLGNVKKATPLLEVAYKPSDPSSGWVRVNATTKIFRSTAEMATDAREKFFAITPKFVRESMVGKFSDTTFLLAGCNTLSNTELAESFVKRGASVVVGWDDTVGSSDNDRGMLQILHRIFSEDQELKQAVNQVNEILVPELMPFPSSLKYYSRAEI